VQIEAMVEGEEAMSETINQTASLSERIAKTRAARLATTPEASKGHFVAAWAGKCSPRRAIKAQCLECIGFDRQAITDCTCYACSLWEFRPFQHKTIKPKTP